MKLETGKMTEQKKYLVIIISICLSPMVGLAADPVGWWQFDKVEDSNTVDAVTQNRDTVQGQYRLVPGVQGQALKLDGYSTCVIRKAENAPQLKQGLAVEAWVAFAAWPWNWVPIVAQEQTAVIEAPRKDICWPATIDPNKAQAGYYFGIGPRGQVALQCAVDGKWVLCTSDDFALSLNQWMHVGACYDPAQGIALYLNGKQIKTLSLTGSLTPAANQDLRFGMNHVKRKAAYPVRPFATLPCFYAIDGLLDEVKLYDRTLTNQQIRACFQQGRPTDKPPFKARRMPSGPQGKGRFGAFYTHLQYDESWDGLWPVSSDPDVVVQFDNSDVRVVFWRGTRYSPAWVMPNGLWMADQGAENFNDRDGCIEHMLDPHCRYSHVRIIENTDARVVVHWRNLPTSANKNFSQVDEVTGWEDWIDEYYTFYPDGIGMRKVIQHTKGKSIWPEEVIVLCHPGQRPEDVIELGAMTLSNHQGQQHTYTWAERSPKFRHNKRWERGGYIDFGDGPGEKPNIMVVNLKSHTKPFQIFDMECNFTCFAHEHRKDVSHFPWWNHWPVAQIPSDGRYCQAPDRASHFSLAWASPRPRKQEDGTYVWAWMHGTTDQEPRYLTDLAKSWVYPPKIKLKGRGFISHGYDRTQRNYDLIRKDARATLTLTLLASPDSPAYNPAFQIKNWGGTTPMVTLNSRTLKPGKDYRLGHVARLDRTDVTVWIRCQSTEPLQIGILETAN
jgi:hypothetical protein